MYNRIFLIAALLMASACRDNPPDKSAEEARIQKEVARRVAAAEIDLKVRKTRMHTIRVIGFIVLAGGAVAGLVWVRKPGFTGMSIGNQPAGPPLWNDHYPSGNGRVIDFPAGQESLTSDHPPDPPTQETIHETPPRA